MLCVRKINFMMFFLLIGSLLPFSRAVYAEDPKPFKCMDLANKELQSSGLGSFEHPSLCTSKSNKPYYSFKNPVAQTEIDLVTSSTPDQNPEAAYQIHFQQTNSLKDLVKKNITFNEFCNITSVTVNRDGKLILIKPSNCKSLNDAIVNYDLDWSKMGQAADSSGFKNSGLSVRILQGLCSQYIPYFEKENPDRPKDSRPKDQIK